MSSIGDLTEINSLMPTDVRTTNSKAGSYDLDFSDFLQLMVAQFQNQDPENMADTSDMLNMLVQMTVVQAVSNITDATTMMYTASLVGQEVTVGVWGADGLEEIVGTVTATGTYGGQPVVFVDGKSYSLSSIMAIGRLPEEEKKTDPGDENGENGNGDEPTTP